MKTIDFAQKGTKLPEFPMGTPFRGKHWTSNDHGTMRSYKGFISYGVQLYKEKEYILAESPDFDASGGSNHFMFPLSEVERLAKEQGMIKETRKELPKSFCIKQDQTNPLWKEYIAWLNTVNESNWSGDCYYYYGITKRFFIDGNYTTCHYDQVITLEEWDEIVNGKQEKQNKMEITRKQLKNIHDVACITWQKKIETEYATRNPWGDTIKFTQKEIDEMFKAAAPNQKEVLEGIFGKQTKEIDLSTGKLDGLELLRIDTSAGVGMNHALLSLRIGGKYENKAFRLNDNYDWEIVTDAHGFKCLVPTRK